MIKKSKKQNENLDYISLQDIVQYFRLISLISSITFSEVIIFIFVQWSSLALQNLFAELILLRCLVWLQFFPSQLKLVIELHNLGWLCLSCLHPFVLLLPKSFRQNVKMSIYIYTYKRLKWFVKQHQLHKTKW
jgi:hypothetical protein